MPKGRPVKARFCQVFVRIDRYRSMDIGELALDAPGASGRFDWRGGRAGSDRTPSEDVAWGVLGLFLLIIALYAVGVIGEVAYPIVLIGGVTGAAIGLRWHRPTRSGPWWMLVLVGLVWTWAGIIDDVFNASGDLSSNRSLIPDLLAIPGYAVFGAALYWLLRLRRGSNERSALLDGLMVAAGASLLVFEGLIRPTFDVPNAWLPAQLAVAAYPTMSMLLLVIAGQLAFSSGERSAAFSLLLAGSISLLVGDVIYALGEIGRLSLPQSVIEIPYLLVPACIATAALHPSMKSMDQGQAETTGTGLGNTRVLAVAAALMVPIAVMAGRDHTVTDLVTVAICVLLATAAVVRLVAAMRDQRVAASVLYHRATHDELTGLPGRTLLVERVGELLSRSTGSPVTLMFLDLDRLKLVNDSMGHNAGDELLRQAARRIVGQAPDERQVYRMSGDEFVVVVEGLGDIDAEALAARIRGSLRRPFQLVSGEAFISASIGVTSAVEGDAERVHQLLQEADEAMYRSKERGRDATTRFDSSMKEQTTRRVEVERLLRHALDTRELKVAYQPIVAGADARIIGFEALARWTVDGTPIHPVEFIPVAEESGLISSLGRFVLDEACRELAAWRRSLPGGHQLTMSVNVSPGQIRTGDIVEVVSDTLRRHGLPGDALWLELTESVMVEESVTTMAVMSALRGLDVRLSVDDFGTGFSSLSYLKRFPVSRVKIDRSFVSGLCDDDSDRSLVVAVIAMASALGLEVVAEGVELAAQAVSLRQLGCDQMQGYLFGPAVSAVNAAELVHTANRSRVPAMRGRVRVGGPSTWPNRPSFQ